MTEQTEQQFAINAQYVKDLSFENPNAPESLTAQKERPDIKIVVDVSVNNLQGDVFEVTLNISANAEAEGKAIFVAELAYAGVFTAVMPKEEQEPLLMIYCPGLLFPFARRILAETVRDGGFPPLMLDPIDFGALYQQHKQGEIEKKSKGANSNNKDN